jgi:anhydro-N-acetylmuramic acid kinase
MDKALYIGLLSGTSVDAIDGVLVDLRYTPPLIVCTHTHPIPEGIRNTVFQLALSGNHEIEALRYLDQQLAQLFSETALALCHKTSIKSEQILAIGSHGQTVRHYPPTPEQAGYSLQIGDPNIIAEQTGITTVADFRRRDIAAGGHGAPLAPALHNTLFRSATSDRIILNTGGIANITYLPRKGETIGFDTGPANGLMDSWCQLHQGQAYDINGRWAARGKVQFALLEQWLQHPYFTLPAPKSTGREDFNLPWLNQELERYGKNLAPEDIQATLLALTTESIARAIDAIDMEAKAEVYICGGGAHNQTFCSALTQRLSPRLFSNTESLGVPPDWVEAIAFAWMAKQTMEKATGNLPSVTGARREVILGGIFQA